LVSWRSLLLSESSLNASRIFSLSENVTGLLFETTSSTLSKNNSRYVFSFRTHDSFSTRWEAFLEKDIDAPLVEMLGLFFAVPVDVFLFIPLVCETLLYVCVLWRNLIVRWLGYEGLSRILSQLSPSMSSHSLLWSLLNLFGCLCF